MIHMLSSITDTSIPIHDRFHGFHIEDILDDSGIKLDPKDKLKVHSNGALNNYGPLLSKIDKILPDVYQSISDIFKADICNKNTGKIGWYFDGMESFALKENLPKVSKYAIETVSKEVHSNSLYISKPSHLYVGSGDFIMIGTKKEVESRKDEYFNGEKLKWIVQPLLTDVMLWHGKYKFDMRFYAVVFSNGKDFYAACYRLGVGRCAVKIHDPVNDPTSAITNIHIQEKIHGYDDEFHLPLLYDDIGMGKELIRDILDKTKLSLDPRKKAQVLILGLDIIFMNDGTYKLIEVNHNPTLEYRCQVSNNEKIASMGFILGLYGYIIPSIMKSRVLSEIDDWDFV